MSVRSGRTTSRVKVAVYKGYAIVKVTIIEHERSIFDPSRFSEYAKSKETHFDFCKDGNEKKPSQFYECWASNIKECKECIDNFINDDSIYFTAEEREKYVYKPNRKCDYAYGYASLMKLLKEHQKADKRMKILIEDRLVSANFHTWAGYLSEGKYEEYEELAASECKFREKFEVYTETLRKRIKDPKQFEDGLKRVIEEYLASQGVKDTSVKVNFIENW